MRVQLNNVRISFAHGLFTPQRAKGSSDGPLKFNSSFLIDPETSAGSKLIAEIEDAMADIAQEKWGDRADKILNGLKKQDRICLRDGDTKSEWEGYEDMMFVSASNETRPLVVDGNRNELSKADGKPYSGCFVNASIEIWAQDNDYGKRINASLRGVQFAKDGDSFSGGGAADIDEFDDLSDHGDDAEDDLA